MNWKVLEGQLELLHTLHTTMSRFYIFVNNAKSKTKLLFFFFTIWTSLCEKIETLFSLLKENKCKKPPWGLNHTKVYYHEKKIVLLLETHSSK